MKIKALLKIATIATVFALLVCTVPVFATEATPEDLRIAYCNLSFENETHLMYAVKSTDESLRLRIWTDGNTADEPDVTLDSLETREIAGENYQVFKYTGLFAHQMTDVVFAAAHDGKVQGTVHKYSIQQYAYSVIKLAEEEGASEEIKNLAPVLKAMLNYGAAMQEYQNHNTDDLANKGISDGYAISKADGWYTAEALDFYEGSDGVFYIRNANGLREFADSVNSGNKTYAGKTVKLLDDIDLGNIAWTPIGQTGATQFLGVFDGQEKTISNLYINTADGNKINNYASGLFGWLNIGTVKNLTIDTVNIEATQKAGTIAGYLEGGATVENCKVIKANISGIHMGSGNDNDSCGDKIGGVVGYMNNNCFVKDCVIENSAISAGRDAGQVVGAGHTAKVTGCSADNVTVGSSGEDCKGGNLNEDIIGRILG